MFSDGVITERSKAKPRNFLTAPNQRKTCFPDHCDGCSICVFGQIPESPARMPERGDCFVDRADGQTATPVRRGCFCSADLQVIKPHEGEPSKSRHNKRTVRNRTVGRRKLDHGIREGLEQACRMHEAIGQYARIAAPWREGSRQRGPPEIKTIFVRLRAHVAQLLGTRPIATCQCKEQNRLCHGSAQLLSQR